MKSTYALLIAFLLVGCESSSSSSSGSSTGTSGGLGARCIDYTSCVAPFICFVAAGDVEGECESLPSQCSSTDCTCLGDALASRCTARGRCSARVDRAVYSCPDTGPRKKEGEACSVARGCEGGLFCRVPTATRLGSCEKLPASCGTTANCDCLKADGCAGGTMRECSILGDDASLLCE